MNNIVYVHRGVCVFNFIKGFKMENIKINSNGWWESDIHIDHLLVPSICNWIIGFLKDYKDHPLYDFGCGTGHYLQKLSEAGYSNLIGYEGKIVKKSLFSNIIKQDISSIFNVPQKGNVICLEVGEHIPAKFEDNLLTNFANTCDRYLILSWSPNDDFGHVNCLTNEQVIPKVVAKGFEFLPQETILAKNAVNDYLHFKSIMIFRKKLMEHFWPTVPGWFNFADLYTQIVLLLPKDAHIVEIGAWKGRSTAFMAVEIANSGKNIKFDVVDNWVGGNGEENDEDVKNGADPYQIFLKHMEPVKHIVNPLKMPSLDAAKLYEDQSLDFVFLDANHSYQGAKEDIAAWRKKVKPGGIFAGHDYNKNAWPGVVQAVNESFGLGNFHTLGECWIVKI